MVSAIVSGAFDDLSPQHVLAAVEALYELELDRTVHRYASYINRVYGIRSVDGTEYIAKFYRPNRWSTAAIAEEHQFVRECAAAELPVVDPIADAAGDTLHEIEFEGDHEASELVLRMALYPKRGGRGFDAERDEDWFRLGSLVGRVHSVGKNGAAPTRIRCVPEASTRAFVTEIRDAGVVHPDVESEFFDVVEEGLAEIMPLFAGTRESRIHGDFHRGNILERGDEGLLLIDFDDMMVGPPVQDLWLLLPDRIGHVRRELVYLLEGYRQFMDFDSEQLVLVEPLRLMRILYYLAWNARQRNDKSFTTDHPEWGSRGFWIREIEDIRTQVEYIRTNDDIPNL